MVLKVILFASILLIHAAFARLFYFECAWLSSIQIMDMINNSPPSLIIDFRAGQLSVIFFVIYSIGHIELLNATLFQRLGRLVKYRKLSMRRRGFQFIYVYGALSFIFGASLAIVLLNERARHFSLKIIEKIDASFPIVERDCSDFDSRDEAQAFYKTAWIGDPHRLDDDQDGIACEWLD